MLVAHLGINDFMQGIGAYLKKHAYSKSDPLLYETPTDKAQVTQELLTYGLH